MRYVVQTHGCFYPPKCHIKYTHLDLPHGALNNNDWQKKFLMTYEKWLGACTEPWLVNKDPNHISVLQAIWNAVYPHINHIVDMDSPVYHIVSPMSFRFVVFIILTSYRPTNVPLSGNAALIQLLSPYSRPPSMVYIFQAKQSILPHTSCFKTMHSCMQVRPENLKR